MIFDETDRIVPAEDPRRGQGEKPLVRVGRVIEKSPVSDYIRVIDFRQVES